jgi:hypothetical protein
VVIVVSIFLAFALEAAQRALADLRRMTKGLEPELELP